MRTHPFAKLLSSAPIDLSLQSHINNARFLKGASQLEGNSFDRTVHYFNQYIDELAAKGANLENILHLKEAFNSLVLHENMISAIMNMSQIKEIGALLSSKILQLANDSSIYLPGGWRNEVISGHGMVYKWTKLADGLRFYVYNAGAGLNYHARFSSLNKELFSPIMDFHIPNPVNRVYLEEFLEQLLLAHHPRLRQNKMSVLNEEKLYLNVLARIYFIHEKTSLLPPSDNSSEVLTAGQVSGTCSQSALNQLIKESFNDLKAYQHFMYHFKLYAFKDYMQKVRDNNYLSNPGVLNLLKHTLSTLGRILLNPGVFNQVEVTEQHLELLRFAAELNSNISIPELRYQAPNPIGDCITNFAINYKTDTTPITTQRQELSRVNFKQKTPDLTGVNLLAEIKSILDTLKLMRDDLQAFAVIEAIEKIFVNLPLPATIEKFYDPIDFYKEINADNQGEFYQLLSDLYELYVNTSRYMPGNSLPRQNVIRLSKISVVDVVRQQCEKDITDSRLYIHKLVREYINKIFCKDQNNPYFATNLPVLDARLLLIKKFYCRSWSWIEEFSFNFDRKLFLNLIDSELQAKQNLLEAYDLKYSGVHQDAKKYKMIRADGFAPLYMLIENQDLIKAPVYDTIRFKFKVVKQLMHVLTERRDVRVEYYDGRFEWVYVSSGLSSVLCYGIGDAFKLLSKYNHLKDQSLIANCLKTYTSLNQQYILNDNEIQLLVYDKKQPASIKSIRPLYHLRNAPDLQINLTIEYFKEHVAKLADQELQIYLEANLFQPGLLLQELNKGPMLLMAKIEDFINTGLTFHNKRGYLSATSLYFIHLFYLVANYVAQANPEIMEAVLAPLQLRLTFLIEMHANHSVEIKHTLHKYQFLTAMSRLKGVNSADPQYLELLKIAVPSLFYINAKNNSDFIVDNAIKFNFYLIEQSIGVYLQGVSHDFLKEQELLIARLLDLGKSNGSLSSSSISSRTNIDNGTYFLDFQKGMVFNSQHMTFSYSVEKYIKELPKHLNLNQATYCMFNSTTGNVLVPELDVNIDTSWMPPELYKAWSANGKKLSYKFLNKKVIDYLDMGITLKLINNLDVWSAADSSGNLLITHNNNLTHRYDFKSQKMHQLDASGKDSGYILCACGWIEQYFAHFESDKYINIYKKQNEENFKIEFLRYDLILQVSNENKGWFATKNWVFRLKDNPAYKLVTDQSTNTGALLPNLPNIATLVFEDEQSSQRQCYIAILPFYCSGRASSNSEFCLFAHDILNLHAQKILDDEFYAKKRIRSKPYISQEKFFNYQLDHTNVPIPSNTHNALYLCYIYLGSHYPEKAWAMLEELRQKFGGLQGNIEELSILQMIMQYLPVNNDKYVVITPMYVACKLKALSMFTAAFTPDRTIIFPEVNYDVSIPDDFYLDYCVKEFKKFYAKLNNTLGKLYSEYQVLSDDLNHVFCLSKREKLDLLEYYHFHLSTNTFNAVGAIGYEWKKLSFELLAKEEMELAAKAARNQKLSVADHQRLQSIRSDFEQDQDVYGCKSILECKPITAFMTDNLRQQYLKRASLDRRFNSYFTDETAKSIAQKTLSALDILSIDMHWTSFESNFWYYYNLLIDPRPSYVENQKRLIDFCRKYLLLHRTTPLEEQESFAIYLCYIFCRLYDNWKYYKLASASFILHFDGISLDEILYVVENILPELNFNSYIISNVHKLLIDKSTIWSQVCEKLVVVKPIKPAADLEPLFLLMKILVMAKTGVSKRNRIQDLMYQYQVQASIYNSAPQISLRAMSDFDQEYQNGLTHYQALLNMKDISFGLLNDYTLKDVLLKSISKFIDIAKTQLRKVWDQSLTLANSKLNSPAEHIKIEIGLRSKLDQAQLLSLYVESTINAYFLATGLDEADINQLHEKLTYIVAFTVRINTLERFIALAASLDQRDKDACQLAVHEIFTEDLVDYNQENNLAIFQYYEKILLRPQQQAILPLLINATEGDLFNNCVAKMIMGGGKSKVFLPLVAKAKALKTNLVVIEVPRSLFETNRADLSYISSRLFGQTLYPFLFNRDSVCTTKSLKFLYDRLMRVMIQQDYVLTTGDAVQSLELKYIEVLLQEEPRDHEKKIEWEQQVIWLGKLVDLFRKRTDVLVDELHKALWNKSKLNYSIGEGQPLPVVVITYSIALYRFFHQLKLADIFVGKFRHETIFSLLENNQLITENADWEKIIIHLTHNLLTHARSPLSQTLSLLNATDLEELRLYLMNKSETIPACVMHANQKDQTIYALYKEQLSKVLPFTLRRNLNENYGPSIQTPDLDIAIPYVANNVPNERSRFSNCFETMNFSIQMLMKSGLSIKQLQSCIDKLLENARLELIAEPGLINIDITPTSRMCESWNLKYKFSELDDRNFLNRVALDLYKNESLISYFLETDLLPQLTMDEEILHSDAYNHVDIYRSFQGVTGTPSNHATYSPRLSYNKHNFVASDGLIMAAMEDKHTSIVAMNYNLSLPKLIETLLRSQPTAHAIIDACAMFRGKYNIDVARALADYLRVHRSKILFVVFWNENNQLTALSVSNAHITPLTTSDSAKIDIMLHCTPAERFCYYPQAQTLGADLVQPQNATGLVLIDHKTTLSCFLQSSMRMRGLLNKQNLVIFAPNISFQALPLKNLFVFMTTNEELQLKQEIFFGLQGAMSNEIRSDVINRSLECTNAADKKRLLDAFREFFVKAAMSEYSFFQRFGQLAKMEDPSVLLFMHRDRLLQMREVALKKINAFEEADAVLWHNKFDEMIAKTLPLCAPKYLSIANSDNEGNEVEVQQEVQVELQIEQELVSAVFKPYSYKSWHLAVSSQYYMKINGFIPLNDLFQYDHIKAPTFGSIYINSNYYCVHHSQRKYITQDLKPVFALLFRKLSNKPLDCVILSQVEAEELVIKFKTSPENNVWISSTSFTILAGIPPQGIDNDEAYQLLIEQVRFFNGEFKLLCEDERPLNWLQVDSEQKLKFFENNLRICRNINQEQISLLQIYLNHIAEWRLEIINNPQHDYIDAEWFMKLAQKIHANPIAQLKIARGLKSQFSLQKIIAIMCLQETAKLRVFLENNQLTTNVELIKCLIDQLDPTIKEIFKTTLLSINSDESIRQALNPVANREGGLLGSVLGFFGRAANSSQESHASAVPAVIGSSI